MEAFLELLADEKAGCARFDHPSYPHWQRAQRLRINQREVLANLRLAFDYLSRRYGKRSERKSTTRIGEAASHAARGETSVTIGLLGVGKFCHEHASTGDEAN